MLSDALWRQRFDGDPSVVGHGIALNGAAYTIVASCTRVLFHRHEGELWLPMAFPPKDPTTTVPATSSGPWVDQARVTWTAASRWRRSRPARTGVSREPGLGATVTTCARRCWATSTGAAGADGGGRPRPPMTCVIWPISCGPGRPRARAKSRPGSPWAQAAAGSSSSSWPEPLPGLIVGAAGLALGFWGVEPAHASCRKRCPRIHETGVAIDGYVLAFTLAASLITGVSRPGAGLQVLGRIRRRSSGGGDGAPPPIRGAGAFRAGWCAAQIALAVTLLSGDGLFISRASSACTRSIPGSRRATCVTMGLELPRACHAGPRVCARFSKPSSSACGAAGRGCGGRQARTARSVEADVAEIHGGGAAAGGHPVEVANVSARQ